MPASLQAPALADRRRSHYRYSLTSQGQHLAPVVPTQERHLSIGTIQPEEGYRGEDKDKGDEGRCA